MWGGTRTPGHIRCVLYEPGLDVYSPEENCEIDLRKLNCGVGDTAPPLAVRHCPGVAVRNDAKTRADS